MIEPTSKDVKRRVLIKREMGPPVSGIIEGFTEKHVTVLLAGEKTKVLREDLEWSPDPRIGPRGLFEGAGLKVVALDELHWRVSDAGDRVHFLFWPSTGIWRYPDGVLGGGGPLQLISAMKGQLSQLAIAQEASSETA